MVAICNGKYYGGGYPINPQANIEGCNPSLVMVESLKKLQMPAFLRAVVKGEYEKFSNVLVTNASQIEVIADYPIIGNIDGEMIENDDFVVDTSATKVKVFHNSELLNLIRKKNT